MNRPYLRSASVVCLLAASLAMTACTSTTPNLDQHFGSGVNLIKEQQLINPQAVHNANPVNGIDGMAAKSAYDTYQKSYKSPEPHSGSLTIGLGR